MRGLQEHKLFQQAQGRTVESVSLEPSPIRS